MLFSSVSIFANTTKQYENKKSNETKKNKVEFANVRTKCQIVGDNIYKYCVDHGYSVIQASSIANAAEAECKRVSIQ
jgi:acetyl-CoA carboxylase beta subunit